VTWLYFLLIGLSVAASVILAAGLAFYWYLMRYYADYLVRIFQEKPLFIIPRGKPIPEAEEVQFATADGLTLRGCYLKTRRAGRRGVILFGLEYGSTRWSCVPYCEHLREAGYDIFTFEPRSQGESEQQSGYEPLQWVTEYEVKDFQAALEYLKYRADADPKGIGFFGISKGGGAGLMAAADDPYVRCFVTDGIFATYTTMVPYMRKWIAIYSTRYWLQWAVPNWFYGLCGRQALKRVVAIRKCSFPDLEKSMRKLAPRPLLMIHGGGDTYIKPEMAQALFKLAREPKEFWLVDGAKHNQALHVAGDEYRRRTLEFFDKHLGREAESATPTDEVSVPTAHRPEPIAS
jgi:pimeloyl-ACP methyl ester carboxylesterase